MTSVQLRWLVTRIFLLLVTLMRYEAKISKLRTLNHSVENVRNLGGN